MSFIKYLLPALAATKFALADDNCGDTTVQTQSDADALASCSTVSGDIKIHQDFSGTLTLNGVQKIEGSITSNNATGLTGIIAPSLQSISDNFWIFESPILTTLSFAELTSIGVIHWEALAGLQHLDFSSGVTDIGDVSIVNTGLRTLDGISLKTVGTFNIENNANLKTVNVNNLTNATNLINFSGNSQQLEIQFPNLGTAKNLTIRNVKTVAIPSLEKLTGQLGFWQTNLTEFSAPNLTATADLTFNGNTGLTNVSLPALSKVDGGFIITRNDELSTILVPDLKSVTGAIDFSGTFNTVDMSALEEVDGGFNLQSTDGKFKCSDFQKMHGDGVIRGKFECKASTSNPTTAGGQSGTSSSSSGSGSSATSSGAAVANMANVPVAGVAAAFYALAQLL